LRRNVPPLRASVRPCWHRPDGGGHAQAGRGPPRGACAHQAGLDRDAVESAPQGARYRRARRDRAQGARARRGGQHVREPVPAAAHQARRRPGAPLDDEISGRALARRQMRAFGGMLSFELRGGEASAKRVAARTKIFALAESLGGVESLIELPLAMTHGSVRGTKLAPPAGLVRLSVGIETIDDLIADLAQAIA